MIGLFDKLLQQQQGTSSGDNILGSLLSGELGKAVKTTSFFFNIPKVISSSLETLGVSADSTISLFKDGKVSEIKVGDVLVASLTPVVKPIVSFMTQSMGVQTKHLGDLVNDIGKLSGLSENTIQALLDSFGLHTTHQSYIKKAQDAFATIRAFMGTTVDSLHLALLQVRDFMETIKYNLEEYWDRFFQLSPKQLFQAYLLPVLPPFLTDIADKVFSKIKSFLKSIILSIASYANKYLLTPISDRVKKWFKKRKEDKEEAILEKLLPKELYEVVKTTEDLLEIAGIKVPSLLKSVAIGSLITYSKHKSALQKVEDKIKPEANIIKKLSESDIVQILLNPMAASSLATATGGMGLIGSTPPVGGSKPTGSGQPSSDDEEKKKKRSFIKMFRSKKQKEEQPKPQAQPQEKKEELTKTKEELVKTREELEKKYEKLAEDIGKVQNSSSEVSEKLRKQLEETADLMKDNDERISQVDNELKSLEEQQKQQKESKTDETCEIIPLVRKVINERLEALTSATGGSLNLVIESVNKTSGTVLNALSAAVSKVSETLQDKGISTKNMMSNVNKAIASAKDSISNISGQVSERVYSTYKSMSEKVKAFKTSGMNVVSSIRNAISRTFQKLKKCNFDIFGKLTSFATFLLGGISKMFSFIKDSVFKIPKMGGMLGSIMPKGIFGKAAFTFLTLKSIKFIDDKFLHGKITSFITKSIPEFFSSLWQKMKDTFFGFIDSVANFLHIDKIIDIFKNIMDFFSRMWESIKEFFQPAIDTIKSALQSLKDAIAPIIDTIKSVLSKIAESVGSFFSSAWGKTKEIASGAVEKTSQFAAGAGRIASTAIEKTIAGRAPSVKQTMEKSYIKDSMAAIVAASQATGVPLETLLGVSYVESGWNPKAKSSVSSASGLFQFLTASKGGKESVWQSVSKKVPVNSIYGNIDNVDNPYRNALAAAINMKSMGEYASVPELVYIKHFIPALAPIMIEVAKGKQPGYLNMHVLLRNAYGKQYQDPQLEEIVNKVEESNKIFFNTLNPKETTAAEFLQNVRNRLYPGIKAGLEVINNLRNDPTFTQKATAALSSLGKNIALNFNLPSQANTSTSAEPTKQVASMLPSVPIAGQAPALKEAKAEGSKKKKTKKGKATAAPPEKDSDKIKNKMGEHVATTDTAEGKDTKTKKAPTPQQRELAQNPALDSRLGASPQLSQPNANGSDPISKAVEQAIKIANGNIDWSLLRVQNLTVSS